MVCPNCNEEGLVGGCPKCGAVKYEMEESSSAHGKLPEAEVPLFYRDKNWDVTLTQRKGDSESVKIVLDKLNDLVTLSSSGSVPNNSYMFLLPQNRGKRIALFSLIKNYQKNGLHVAPVVDIASLNLITSRNRYEDQETLLAIFKSDITFVYGTDFITRKLTSRVFREISSTRALTGRPTIFFGGHSYKELASWDNFDNEGLNTNLKKEDHLAIPYILDGVVRRV